ncbi:hypothetical protein [Mycoplasmopsis columbinasalis]|uniref:Uncharacterized protein n=1 Tax=Mycoplasmopsis columbinasalis TaxID=114880 RepID=A0A449BAK1_9BACT|nr:hypothetical protein [Mycoplasmopsis columbinasalis]VEU78056.1 Uncharacterised protein [Mycoplasmopsis columbinasalis]
MTKPKFTKLTVDQEKNIYGGVLPALPLFLVGAVLLGNLVIKAFTGIVGGVKAATSVNGEVKTEDTTAKWSNPTVAQNSQPPGGNNIQPTEKIVYLAY